MIEEYLVFLERFVSSSGVSFDQSVRWGRKSNISIQEILCGYELT